MATAIPPPFGTITSLEDSAQAIREAGVKLSVESTKLPSQFTIKNAQEFLYESSHFEESESTDDAKYIRTVATDLFITVLKYAAPQEAQVYFMSAKFLERSKSYFDGAENAAHDLAEVYEKYLPVGSARSDPDELALYHRACMEWREYMSEMIPPEMNIQEKKNATRVDVGGYLKEFGSMYANMEKKRCKLASSLFTDDIDIIAVKTAFQEELPVLPFPLQERSKTVVDGAMELNDQGEIVSTPNGPLLVSVASINELTEDESAASYMVQIINNRLKDLYLTLKAKQDKTKDETELLNMITVTVKETFAIPTALLSNGDLFFNTHFLLFKILELSILEFYDFQSVIYVLGRKLLGKTLAMAYLVSLNRLPGISKFITKISESTEPGLPPWVMNWNRLSDMVAIIGACDCTHFELTVRNPAISWRYISNFSYISCDITQFLLHMFWIEERMDKLNSKKDDYIPDRLFLSELALSELLSGRRNVFVNTYKTRGEEIPVSVTL